MAESRRSSKDLPILFSALFGKVQVSGKEFIRLFDKYQGRMEAISRELSVIAGKVKDTHGAANTVRGVGAVSLGASLVGTGAVCLLTGGLGLPFIVGLCAAAVAGAAVVGTNTYKVLKDSGYADVLKQKGEEFMTIVKLQNECLGEIAEAYKECDEKSSVVRTEVEASLSDSIELKRLLEKMAELAAVKRTLSVSVALMEIIKAADMCKTTVSEFQKLKCLLENFLK